MSNQIANTNPDALLEAIVANGDLGKLTLEQRTKYLVALCESMGLNPLSRPIEFITLQGRTVPYAKKDCTDQLRKIHRISIEIVNRETVDGVYTVTARATDPSGRVDEDVGSVVVNGLKGESLANATMKCHTKSKRRVTLSICGLGILDESELDTIANVAPVAPAQESRQLPPAAKVESATPRADEAKAITYIEEVGKSLSSKEMSAIAVRLSRESKAVKDAVRPVYADRVKFIEKMEAEQDEAPVDREPGQEG